MSNLDLAIARDAARAAAQVAPPTSGPSFWTVALVLALGAVALGLALRGRR
jgi:hypothetical protein